MKKGKVRWVDRRSSLHKKLETANSVGFHKGVRATLDYLTEEQGLSDAYIAWLVEEKIMAHEKKSR